MVRLVRSLAFATVLTHTLGMCSAHHVGYSPPCEKRQAHDSAPGCVDLGCHADSSQHEQHPTPSHDEGGPHCAGITCDFVVPESGSAGSWRGPAPWVAVVACNVPTYLATPGAWHRVESWATGSGLSPPAYLLHRALLL
jgi:hypothetical protein